MCNARPWSHASYGPTGEAPRPRRCHPDAPLGGRRVRIHRQVEIPVEQRGIEPLTSALRTPQLTAISTERSAILYGLSVRQPRCVITFDAPPPACSALLHLADRTRAAVPPVEPRPEQVVLLRVLAVGQTKSSRVSDAGSSQAQRRTGRRFYCVVWPTGSPVRPGSPRPSTVARSWRCSSPWKSRSTGSWKVIASR